MLLQYIISGVYTVQMFQMIKLRYIQIARANITKIVTLETRFAIQAPNIG